MLIYWSDYYEITYLRLLSEGAKSYVVSSMLNPELIKKSRVKLSTYSEGFKLTQDEALSPRKISRYSTLHTSCETIKSRAFRNQAFIMHF